MLIWNSSKLTTAGKALLAKAQAGKATIKITKAQTGSGSYTSGETVDTRTALKVPQQTFPISDTQISNDSTLVLKVTISNKTEEMDMRSKNLVSLRRIQIKEKSYIQSRLQAQAITCQLTTM